MNNKKYQLMITLFVISLIMMACSFGTITQPDVQQPGQVQTSVAQTVEALQTIPALETLLAQSTQDVQSPTIQLSDTLQAPTVTSTPTTTSTATYLPPTATSIPPTATPIPCYRVQFVADVTYPDGSILRPNSTFTKTWRLKNNGTCTWTSDFDLVFVSGSSMGAPSYVDFHTTVNPGGTIDLSVSMKAPSTPGTYAGYWKIRSASGVLFGWGANGTEAFWVKIKVEEQDYKWDLSAPLDFAYNYCNARWESAYGVLPCPGASSDYTKGNVTRTNTPRLEGGYQDDEPAIIMVPNNGSGGYISGRFPAFTVKNGDKFTTLVGCIYDNTNCNAMLQLNYSIDNGPIQNLGSWTENYDGSFRQISVDLSPLAGEVVEFILTVNNNDGASKEDKIFWMVPKVVR